MGKRGNGEGSITRRKDGLYMARYTIQTATGTKRKTIYGKEREDVAEKLADALSNRNRGLVSDAGSQTVGEYLERWLETSAKGSVRESTYASYRKQVRCYVVPAIGRVKLKGLTSMQIQGMYRAMLDRGLSPRTVQYTHAVLHRTLRQAVRGGPDSAQRLGGRGPATPPSGRDTTPQPRPGPPPPQDCRRIRGPLRGPLRPSLTHRDATRRTARLEVGGCRSRRGRPPAQSCTRG